MQPSDTSASRGLQSNGTSTPPSAAGGRFSLLTDRWHASSRVVAAGAMLFLVFCNVPGQRVEIAERPIPSFPYWATEQQLEHGWPLTYLARNPHGDLPYPTETSSKLWQWKSWDGVRRFHLGALAVNVAAMLLGAAAAGIAFEAWRRQRKRLWQLHLRDLAAVLTLACLLVAWYGALRRSKAAEEAALARSRGATNGMFDKGGLPYLYAGRSSEGGSTWIRELVGDGPFWPLDRAVELSVNRAGLAEASPLTCVESLKVYGSLTEQDLPQLARFRKLEALALKRLYIDDGVDYYPGTDSRPESEIQLPRLPRLRVLDLRSSEARLSGLADLRALESIILEDAHVDERMLRDLATLPKLRRVSLQSGFLDPAGYKHLAALEHLERLELVMVPITEEGLVHLGKLHRLKDLYVSPSTVPADSLRHLAGLTSLESLNLSGMPVSEHYVRYLAGLENLRELDLSHTTVTPDAIGELARMKQLRRLNVSNTGLSNSDIDRLAELLPLCTVEGRELAFFSRWLHFSEPGLNWPPTPSSRGDK